MSILTLLAATEFPDQSTDSYENSNKNRLFIIAIGVVTAVGLLYLFRRPIGRSLTRPPSLPLERPRERVLDPIPPVRMPLRPLPLKSNEPPTINRELLAGDKPVYEVRKIGDLSNYDGSVVKYVIVHQQDGKHVLRYSTNQVAPHSCLVLGNGAEEVVCAGNMRGDPFKTGTLTIDGSSRGYESTHHRVTLGSRIISGKDLIANRSGLVVAKEILEKMLGVEIDNGVLPLMPLAG